MNWPAPQDFNEAVQNPGLVFTDPDLKGGRTVVGATGLPLPRSGNFADVYQVKGADGRDWAVKCFTRAVAGLDQRYRQLGDFLSTMNLPFTVGFNYFSKGVQVREAWYPALKMEWVEGLLLNQFVRDNAGRPAVLEALFQMWARLARRLREAGVAHADLQHGNVLLVPGTKPGTFGLKLIDYDGMFVPALANQPPGELGHANYQHPRRASDREFTSDLDRFPLLAIATGLKGLLGVGPSLWERYDTGENLLFTEADFLDPTQSPLMHELWRSGDPALKALVGRLASACLRPIAQTPWLDSIVPDGVIRPLLAEEAASAARLFQVGEPLPLAEDPSVPRGTRVANEPGARPRMGTRLASLPPDVRPPAQEPRGEDRAVPRPGTKKSASILPYVIGFVVLSAIVLGGLVVAYSGGNKKGDKVVEAARVEEGKTAKPEPSEAAPRPTEAVKPPEPKPGPMTPEETPLTPPVADEGMGVVAPAPRPVPPAPVPPPQPAAGRYELWTKKPAELGFVSPGELVFSGDGKTLFAYARGKGFFGFNALTGRPVSEIKVDPQMPVKGLQPFGPGLAFYSGPKVWAVPGPADPNRALKNIVTVRQIEELLSLYAHPDGSSLVYEFAKGSVVARNIDPESQQIVSSSPKGGDRSFFLAGPMAKDNTGKLGIVSTKNIMVIQHPGGRAPNQYLSRDGRKFGFRQVAPDGRYALVSVGVGSPELRVIDLTIGQAVSTCESLSPTNFLASDGSLVLFGPTTRILTPDSALPGPPIPLFDGTFTLAAMAPEDRLAAAVCGDGSIRLFRLPPPNEVVEAKAPIKPVEPVPAKPVAERTIKPILMAELDANKPGEVAFSRDGRSLFATNEAGKLYGYDLRTGKLEKTFVTNGQGSVVPIHAIPTVQGEVVLTSSSVYMPPSIWNPVRGRITPLTIPPVPKPIEFTRTGGLFFAISPDARYAFAAYKDVVLRDPKSPTAFHARKSPFRVFDLKTHKAVAAGELEGRAAWFSPDSTRLLVVKMSGGSTWFKIPSGAPDGVIPRPGNLGDRVTVLGMTAGGKRVLLESHPLGVGGGVTTQLAVYDGTTGKEIRRLPGDKGALSEDGRFVAVAVSRVDGMGRVLGFEVIEVDTGNRVARGDIAQVTTEFSPFIALSGEGRYLAIYRNTGQVQVYDLGPPAEATPARLAAVPAGARLPAPAEAAVAKAEADVHSVLKSGYAAKTQADRKAFALDLLKLAAETKQNPADRFVIYRDACDFAIEAGEPALAMRAVNEIVGAFDLDGPALRQKALERMLAALNSAAALKIVVEQALAVADSLWDADDSDRPLKLAQIAASAARKANFAAGAEEANLWQAEFRKKQRSVAAIKSALERLQAAPDDAEANLAVGRSRCLVQGRWEAGLKNLAKGSDDKLKALAALEAAAAGEGPVDANIADRWWDYSESAGEADRLPAKARPRYWYEKALPALVGLARTQVEARMSFDLGGATYRPGLIAEFTPASVVKGAKALVDATFEFTDSNGLRVRSVGGP